MRKTTTFFVLVASSLIQLTAARKEHVICHDVLQIPNIIESDGRNGYDTDILQEIRIRTNLTTDSCNAVLKLHHYGQEKFNDPHEISTSQTMRNSGQLKTQIHLDETSIIGNNMAAKNRRRTDKRMASTKDIIANQDGKIRRDVRFCESRRRLNDEYRCLSRFDYRRIFTDRKRRHNSKINDLLSDTRRDETALNSRKREHFTRGDGRQNIRRQQSHVTNNRKEDTTLARYNARRNEDIRDTTSGLDHMSGFNVVRNIARIEVQGKTPLTRDLTSGEKTFGETRNVVYNNKNVSRTRRSIDSIRKGEVMGKQTRRDDRRNLARRFRKERIRNNDYNGKELRRISDGRVTNLYSHNTSIQRRMKENIIRSARGDLSVSTISRRTTEKRQMDWEVREIRAVKINVREQHAKLYMLQNTRESDEKRHCGSSSVRCIETKAISLRVNQPEKRMVHMKQHHQRDIILQSRRDDKSTLIQRHRYRSYIRQGNYNKQRTDIIDMMGIDRGKSHERVAHFEDITRALMVAPDAQRSSTERHYVTSNRRFHSEVSRLTNRRNSIRQTIGSSLIPNKDVLETERVTVEQRVRKGANKMTYITEQREDVRRSLQITKSERQDMLVSSSQDTLRKNRGHKRDDTICKKKRQGHFSIAGKETISSASERQRLNIRSTDVPLRSRRESQTGLTKARSGRILPKTQRKGNNKVNKLYFSM
ncbi:hypothetical protein ACJMK2_028947 [Sinanodonta woodiana]|uniref:Uncharacterized protein n=1 Tax=Sinanodonta woodiana TaxID=1069815 RepID=A0ABD3XC99_SINWO